VRLNTPFILLRIYLQAYRTFTSIERRDHALPTPHSSQATTDDHRRVEVPTAPRLRRRLRRLLEERIYRPKSRVNGQFPFFSPSFFHNRLLLSTSTGNLPGKMAAWREVSPPSATGQRAKTPKSPKRTLGNTGLLAASSTTSTWNLRQRWAGTPAPSPHARARAHPPAPLADRPPFLTLPRYPGCEPGFYGGEEFVALWDWELRKLQGKGTQLIDGNSTAEDMLVLTPFLDLHLDPTGHSISASQTFKSGAMATRHAGHPLNGRPHHEVVRMDGVLRGGDEPLALLRGMRPNADLAHLPPGDSWRPKRRDIFTSPMLQYTGFDMPSPRVLLPKFASRHAAMQHAVEPLRVREND